MFISKEAINEQETQIAVDLDNITILPTTETIVVRVTEKYLDSEDKVLRTKSAGQIIFRNIESSTAYTTFLVKAGIDIQKIKDALK